MEHKAYLKSKTMNSLVLAMVIVLLNILGVGESKPGYETYDTIGEMQGRQTEQIKNLLTLGALGGAAYGRAVADKKLGKKKDEEE